MNSLAPAKYGHSAFEFTNSNCPSRTIGQQTFGTANDICFVARLGSRSFDSLRQTEVLS